MFALLKNALTKAFSRPQSSEAPDICYFGGIEENTEGLKANEMMLNIYYPSETEHELIFLPDVTTDEDVMQQMRAMEIGEGFKLVRSESAGQLSSDILKIERFNPPRFVHIEGLPTNHPELPVYPILKL